MHESVSAFFMSVIIAYICIILVVIFYIIYHTRAVCFLGMNF